MPVLVFDASTGFSFLFLFLNMCFGSLNRSLLGLFGDMVWAVFRNFVLTSLLIIMYLILRL